MTGKLVNNEHAGTRFGDEHPFGKLAQGLYSAEDLHTTVKKFNNEIKSYSLTPVEIAIRWLAHHSVLGIEDGIVLGASKVKQVRETVAMIHKGPLPEEVLKSVEGLWSAVKGSRGNII